MKFILIALIVGVVASGSLRAADGTIVFNNRIGLLLEAPVYGPEPSDLSLRLAGNDASGVPPGVNVYTGPRLGGPGYSAELWFMPSDGVTFAPVPGAQTTFRVGAPGFIVPLSDPLIPGVGPGEQAMLQLRAWDNQGSTITDWNTAVLLNAARGASTPFLSEPLGGITAANRPVTSPNLIRLTSFNIAVPEPEFAAVAFLLGTAAFAGLRKRSRSKGPTT